jgi:hypothetical protein
MATASSRRAGSHRSRGTEEIIQRSRTLGHSRAGALFAHRRLGPV